MDRWAGTARAVPLVLAFLLSTGCGALGIGSGTDSKSATPTATGSASASESPTSTRAPTPTPTAPPVTSWGPTEAEWARAKRLVARMSLAEKAGQVIVAGFGGTSAPTSLVRRYHLGGVIIMGYNVASADQVRSVNRALQEEARGQGRGWPLAIGIDQEGGTVARIEEPLTEFPTYMTLGASRDAALARKAARASGDELRALGFTMVFAPDADVTDGPSDPTIGSRSAGSDPALVASIVNGSLRGYADAGIVAVPKHFPGHGSVPADSHVSLPVQRASLAELAKRDLVPFASAVKAGAPAVMVAHIDVRDVDPGTPSSVSGKVVKGLLRDRLGFEGAVVTDALEMAGIADKYGSAEAGVRALLAGADVLLMPVDVAATHAAVMRAVRSGRLPQARLDEAAARSAALMLHQLAASNAPSMDVVGTASKLSETVSLRGLTVASGPCAGRLVGQQVQVVGGRESDQAGFTAAARAAGLQVGTTGDVVRLLSRGSSSGSGDVVVALDTPYGLGRSRAGTARIALYGRTPGAFRALVEVLTGRARGGGYLPVEVKGLPPRAGCD
ncbi:glycoside hydrolase family 3 protein [Actinopolymorpha alba]|uniref:glycoside hydrolase family 3 protein n=1 Tax=Actinopolymorpha alba TaxID=533267 RepID=UPI0003A8D486|nr:glycoside hydrolase family 3 N-terminal domain-containing protein [Actinopolymorpha alba]